MRITPDMAWDMAVMYNAGVQLNRIAPRYGITPAAVLYHLRKQGVQTRGRGSRPPFVAIANRAKIVRYRQTVAADKAKRQHQTCDECGGTYAKDRWTVICGAKRCRQQRDYKNRIADPVRNAKMRINHHDAYMRRKKRFAAKEVLA